MSKTENKWRDSKLRPFLDSLPECEYFIKEALAIRALPDIIGVWKGTPFYLEVKRSKSGKSENRAKLQDFTLNKFKKAGAFASFIYPENAEEVLSDLVMRLWKDSKIGANEREELLKLIRLSFNIKTLKPRKNKLESFELPSITISFSDEN